MELFDDFETTPHKKKSQVKPPKKAKHKHDFQPCILMCPKQWFMKGGSRQDNSYEPQLLFYCPVCGKTGSVQDREKWWKSVKTPQGYYRTEETELLKRELDPKTRTLPTFYDETPWPKFVTLKEDE